MNKRESFIFHAEWFAGIRGLPEGIKVEVYEAIIEYGLTGTTSAALKPVAAAVFEMCRARIDADRGRYEATCERRREAGFRGGRPTKQKVSEKAKETKKSNRFSKKQLLSEKAKETNCKQKNPDNDIDYDMIDNSNELSLSAANAAEARARPSSDLFVQFWTAYPPERRARKAKLAEEWERRKLDAVAPAIMARLAYDKKTAQWSDVRYVPLAQTWLNAEPWVDFDATTARSQPPPQEVQRLTPVQVQSLRERRFSLLSTKRALGELTPTQRAELADIEKQLSPLSGLG